MPARMEALVGFALLTATVSWILGIYPALARRRALALRISHLRRADPTREQLDSDAGVTVLDGPATDVARICVDLLQYAESYYFHDGQDATSLAVNAGYAAELADRARSAHRADVQVSVTVLTTALDDLAVILDERLLHVGGTTRDTFRSEVRRTGLATQRHLGALFIRL